MTKTKAILICMVLIAIFSTIIYFNYENIQNYINNKEWEVANSIATIGLDKFVNLSGTNNLLVINSDGIKAYDDSSNIKLEIKSTFSDVVKDAKKEYSIVAEKNGSKVFCINKDKEVWNVSLSGNIKSVSINKNGYAAIVYVQSGYKSLIKVIKPTGEELFTSYLATTYAVSTSISNDNKILAIAEVNTDGIKIESNIKIIELENISNENVSLIALYEGSLVSDIEFNDKNELLILEDDRIQKLDTNKNLTDIVTYNYKDTVFADVSGGNNAITISKSSTGIFNEEYSVKIFKNAEKYDEYIMSNVPQKIYVSNKVLAIDVGNQVLFVNTNNGNLIKRCSLNGKLKGLQIYSDGSTVALVFREKIEIIKL